MNIGIVVDQLIKRDYATTVLESCLSLLENDEITIYTPVHNPGQILGQVELNRIISSFLSSFIKSIESFDRSVFKKIMASGSLKVSTEHDLILVLSSGHSELIKLPKNTPKILVKLYGQNPSMSVQKIIQKKNYHYDVVLSPFKKTAAELIAPFHKIEDIEFKNYDLKMVTVFVDHLTEAEEIINVKKQLLKNNLIISWVGRDQEHNPKEVFFKNPCGSEVSSMLNQSLFSIDLSSKSEPNYLLSLMAGRPILIHESEKELMSFVSEGIIFTSFSGNELGQTITELLGNIKKYDSHELHLSAGKQTAKKFKRELWPIIKRTGK